MDISARRLRIDDAEFAVRIASDVTRRKVSVERERTFLSDNSNILVVGLCDDEPSGFVVAHILDRFKDTSRKVLIYEVDVLPEFQRRGVGRAMMMKLMEVVRTSGADTAFVLTNHSNEAAVGLYTSMGGRAKHIDDLLFEFAIQKPQ